LNNPFTYFKCFLCLSIIVKVVFTKHLMNFLKLILTFYELFINLRTQYELIQVLHMNLFKNFIWTSFEFLTNFFTTSYKLLTNFLWTSFKLLMNSLKTSFELLKNFLWTSYEFLLKTSLKLLMNFLRPPPPWTSYKISTNFLQTKRLFH
jgi:hypothetical protein